MPLDTLRLLHLVVQRRRNKASAEQELSKAGIIYTGTVEFVPCHSTHHVGKTCAIMLYHFSWLRFSRGLAWLWNFHQRDFPFRGTGRMHYCNDRLSLPPVRSYRVWHAMTEQNRAENVTEARSHSTSPQTPPFLPPTHLSIESIHRLSRHSSQPQTLL